MPTENELRAYLEAEELRLRGDLATLQTRARVVEGRDPSTYATHVADDATETFDEEREQALARHIEGILDQVCRAHRKLDLGTYGRCDLCDRPIDRGRLQALPHAILCLDCQLRSEGSR